MLPCPPRTSVRGQVAVSGCPLAVKAKQISDFCAGTPAAEVPGARRAHSHSPSNLHDTENIMDIQQKLTGFAMMGATWIMWLLVGLSIGGVAVALERAIYLIRTTENGR